MGTGSRRSSKADLQPPTPSTHTLCPQMPTHQQAHTSPAIRPRPSGPQNTGREGNKNPDADTEPLASPASWGPSPTVFQPACPQPCLRTNPGPRSGAVRGGGPLTQPPVGNRAQAERRSHLQHHIPTDLVCPGCPTPPAPVDLGLQTLGEGGHGLLRCSYRTGSSLPPDPAHPPTHLQPASLPAPQELSAHAPAGGTHKHKLIYHQPKQTTIRRQECFLTHTYTQTHKATWQSLATRADSAGRDGRDLLRSGSRQLGARGWGWEEALQLVHTWPGTYLSLASALSAPQEGGPGPKPR